MEEDLKRRMIRRYFITPALKYPVGIVGVGVLQVLAGTADIGVAVMLSGVAILATALRGDSASEEQLDVWFCEDLAKIEENAHRRIYQGEDNLEKGASVVYGPITEKVPGILQEEILWRKGRDDSYRWTISRVLIIFYRKHDIDCYECHFNFLKNLTPNEQYSRYFYRDVVSVSMGESERSGVSEKGEKKSLTTQSLEISFVNSKTINMDVKVSERGDVPSDIENSVRTIRKMLQEKKETM